jgi:hypothetical protein
LSLHNTIAIGTTLSILSTVTAVATHHPLPPFTTVMSHPGDLKTIGMYLTGLQSLDLINCRELKGSIKSLESLVGCSEVNLYACVNVKGPFKSFASMPNLRVLCIANCPKITGKLKSMTEVCFRPASWHPGNPQTLRPSARPRSNVCCCPQSGLDLSGPLGTGRDVACLPVGMSP